MRLDGQVAIVTGASRGIGKAIAHTLGQRGAHVVLASRNVQTLADVTAEFGGAGLSVLQVPTDITDESHVRGLVEQCLASFGRIDILVNNAGVGFFKKVHELSVREFDQMWNVNMRGVFLATKAVLPIMMAAKKGDIVNIASLAGKNSFVGGAGYAATKWALRGFAGSLMLEARESNIRVTTICPGSVDTTFSSVNLRGNKITQPEDVADAVLFAVTAPERSMFSEIDIRPTNPK